MMGDSRLLPNAFEGDMGDIHPDIAHACSITDPAKRLEAIVDALQRGRVFAGIKIPEGVEEGIQASIEVAGREAYAVFSSADALAAFDAAARPVPLLGQNAAAQALMGTGLLALDPNGEGEGATLIGRSACAAIAAGEPWLAPWADEGISTRLRTSLGIVERARNIWVRPSAAGIVLVAIEMSETASQSDAERATAIVMHELAHDEYLHARLDVVRVVPVRSA